MSLRTCRQNHKRETLPIDRERAIPHETEEERYARVCRQLGRNPWCGRPLVKCPEGS